MKIYLNVNRNFLQLQTAPAPVEAVLLPPTTLLGGDLTHPHPPPLPPHLPRLILLMGETTGNLVSRPNGNMFTGNLPQKLIPMIVGYFYFNVVTQK